MANGTRDLDAPNASPPQTRTVAVATFSGPLPPPEALARYDQVVPGAAERIIAMAEKQADHRRAMERQVISNDVRNSRLGLWFALLVGLAGLGAAAVIAIWGHSFAGGFIGTATIGSLVGAFIYGARFRRP